MSSSSSPSSTSGSATSCSTVGNPAEPRALFGSEESPVLGAEGGTPAQAAAAAAPCPQQEGEEKEQHEWPPPSFARMRAGLRSALKTDCSGFKFQNGGRSVRWFREHPIDDWVGTTERARLFWQGHVNLFEQSWGRLKMLDVLCRSQYYLWRAFEDVDTQAACRNRLQPGRETASRNPNHSHVQAILADGHVERAVRWALDRRSGMERDILAPFSEQSRRDTLLALALVGNWTWLLERWQAAVLEQEWSQMLAAAVLQAESPQLVESAHAHIKGTAQFTLAMSVGRAGGIDVADSVLNCCPDREMDMAVSVACEHGHLGLVQHLQTRIAAPQFDRGATRWLNSAAASGHLHVVEWLVSQGAEPNQHALQDAVRHGHYTVVRYLHEGAGLAFGTSTRASKTLIYQSKPECLQLLEYIHQRFECTFSTLDIVEAATTPNVRADVLRFLATHVSQEAWAGALAHRSVREDLDVQDLLHAAGPPGVRQTLT